MQLLIYRSTLRWWFCITFCCCVAIAYASGRSSRKPFPTTPDIVLLGDSNTWIGGDDCSQEQGWNYWFAQHFPHRSIRSYARSGATWTHTLKTSRDEQQNTGKLADNNVVSNQVFRLISAYRNGTQPTPHLIIIAAGTNDFWFLQARPSALLQDVSRVFALPQQEVLKTPLNRLLSLAQAMRYDCTLLQQTFPQARIILLSPLQSTAFSAERLAEGTARMVQIAQQLRLPLIRQDKICSLRADDERKNFVYSTDGTHTSVLGAQRNGQILAQHITNILQTQRISQR